ncbi:MAG TPA: hypothetical protein VIL34_00250 [Actinopolymorphaceae bacterium]|jgi:hypothetical protein
MNATPDSLRSLVSRAVQACRTTEPVTTYVDMTTTYAKPTTIRYARHVRSDTMRLLHDELARAQMRERVAYSRHKRLVDQLRKARRLSRRSERVQAKERLVRARLYESICS